MKQSMLRVLAKLKISHAIVAAALFFMGAAAPAYEFT